MIGAIPSSEFGVRHALNVHGESTTGLRGYLNAHGHRTDANGNFWENPEYEQRVREAFREMQEANDRPINAERVNAYIAAKEAEKKLQLYWGHYLAETGNFLEYQRGMSL